MLTDSAGSQTQPPGDRVSRLSTWRGRRSDVVAFAAATALVLLYSLRGGAYDLVVFEEYGLLIWWVLALSIALGLLPRARPAPMVLLALGGLLVYSLWILLSLLWTESAERTTVELARTLDYLGLMAILAVSVDRQTWRTCAAGLGFGALLVCALAVGSRVFPGAFPHDPITQGLDTDRLSYPFGYWNAVGAWGAMATAIGLAWSAHDDSPLRRSVALGLVPTACVATYLSYSRAGVVGTALAVVAVCLLSRNRITVLIHTVIGACAATVAILAVRSAPGIAHATGSHGAARVLAATLVACGLSAAGAILTHRGRVDTRRLPRRLSRRLTMVILVALAIAGGAFGPHLASTEWHSFTHPENVQPTDPSSRLLSLSGTRYFVWKSALKAFRQYPLTGTGAGTFEFWWNRNATTYEFTQQAHSIWLQNLAELGAPGLLLILTALGATLAVAVAVRRRVRRRQSAGVATAFLAAFIVYLIHASVDWMWESTAVSVLALAGITVAGGRLSRPAVGLRWPLRAGFSLLAAVAALVQVPGLLSTTEIRRSQSAERAGNAAAALAWANDAVSAEPWSASAYEQRALVLESAGRLPAAARDLRAAISREPTNFTHWLILSRVETERGALAQAARDYAKAHSLRPLAAVFLLASEFKQR